MKLIRLLSLGLIILAGCTPPTKQPPIEKTNTPTVVQVDPTSPIPEPTRKSIGQKIDRENVNKLSESASAQMENIGRIYWLPDGTSIAVFGYKNIQILDGETLQVKMNISLQEDETLLDFAPVPQYLAVTKDRNTLTIEDLNGKLVSTISQTGGFGSASFSSTGEYIWLSSMENFEAAAYNVLTGEQEFSCNEFETAAPVYAVYPSPQGNWLVWQARATIQLNKLPDCAAGTRIGHEDFVISHTFSNDEKTLVTSTGGTYKDEFQPLVFFWNAQTGERTGTIPLKEYPATGMTFSPNDEVLVTAGNGLIIWDAVSKNKIIELTPPGNRLSATAFSPDGTVLAAADEKSLHLFTIQPE